MSAIAGVLSRDGAPVACRVIQRMTASLHHRGPHAAGAVAFPVEPGRASFQSVPETGGGAVDPDTRWPCLLANRRLFTHSDSPQHPDALAANEDRSVWLSFDGHVYNSAELRGELKRRGHIFRSLDEAEVVVHLYEEEGEDLLRALDGIFALALWDNRKKRLLLARDRVGVKPLYYSLDERRIAFASEIRALIAGGIIVPSPHPQAVAEYFAFQNTLGAQTLFRDVQILLPATSLIVEGRHFTERRWWRPRLDSQVFAGRALEDGAAELRQLLQQTVRSQVFDTPSVGCYLSGGVDSGSLVALASANISGLPTFTCGFEANHPGAPEADFDERARASRVAKQYETTHHEATIAPGDMVEVLPGLVAAEEELRLGMTYQNYCAARLAGDHVRVVLGGSGGDELFAGYPWRHAPAAACRSREQFDALYLKTYQRMVPEAQRPQLFSEEMNRAIGDYSPRDAFAAVFEADDPPDDFLHRALIFEIRTILHASLAMDDKIHMSRSLDYRAPLVANRVLDLALSIPPRWKLGDGIGKLVLRQALRGLLPEEMLALPKQGFCPPDRHWFRGPMLPDIRDVIFSKSALARNVFNTAYVRRVLDEHTEGLADHRLLIWSFVCFEWWHRTWVDNRA